VPERSPLDISGILADYAPFLGHAAQEEKPPPFFEADGGFFDRPTRLGRGPAQWASGTVLAPRVMVCHDVNGYYCELGVHWRATRRELRQAYQALDGQSSPRLTYVLLQLLDPVQRAAYDAAPLGHPFLDEYTQQEIKQRAAREAASRTGRTGSVTSVDDVLDDWGMRMVHESDQALDSAAGAGQDRHNGSGNSRSSLTSWDYATYAWRTSSFMRDESRLQEWQAALCQAAAMFPDPPVLTIGMTVSEVPYTLVAVPEGTAIFFSEDAEPSAETARQALVHLDVENTPHTPNTSQNT